jgi:hypothetical protein
MDQLMNNFLKMNIDGQQRLPFQAIQNQPSISYQLQEYTANRYIDAIAQRPVASASATQTQSMELDDDDDEMSGSSTAAAAAAALRRSTRLAAKPRVSYKE